MSSMNFKKTLLIRLLLILGSKLGFLDKWGHRLHIPKFSQTPICDAWDWHLGDEDSWGDPDEEANNGADCKD